MSTTTSQPLRRVQELHNFLGLHSLSLSLSWAGHGSNVQGLETTATFVPETDEFELHTPTLTGSGPLRYLLEC